MQRIHYTKPSITKLEIAYANDAVSTGWGERCYDYINKFEIAFAEHLGVRHAIATSSCTGALHMGLSALGISAGDEVILADSNWVASVAPIVHLGAKPIFVDILEDSWCLDPVAVEAAISPRTRAIIAVHLYGNLCDLDALREISSRYKIALVEDAAEAIGSRWHGQAAGSLGCFGTFSFHGTKTLTTGEGGMFVTNDTALFEQVLTLSNHGRSRYQTKQFWPEIVGFKYKMSNVQAAIGLAQTERLPELIQRKRQILNYYRTKLESATLRMNPESTDTINGAWMPTAVFARQLGITRKILLKAFADANIDARIFFNPLTKLPMFGYQTSCFHATDIADRAINLPSYHDISQTEQDRVISVIYQCLESHYG